MIKCISRHENPLPEADAWLDILGVQEPHHQMAKLTLRTARVCAEAQLLFNSSVHDGGWEDRLLAVSRRAILLDLDFQSWIDQCCSSQYWSYETLYAPPGLDVPAAQMLHVHRDIWIAHVWMGCRSKRVHLHEVLLHCLDLLGPDPRTEGLKRFQFLDRDEDLWERSTRIIEDMVSGICASMPFLFGDINQSGELADPDTIKPLGGWLAIWHLHVARTSSEEGSEREAWLISRMLLISSVLRIRSGVIMARQKRKERWELT